MSALLRSPSAKLHHMPPAQPLVHIVHFWLRPDLPATDRATFLTALRTLADSPNVATCRIGQPANTARDVVDNTWDYQLLLSFTDRAAHDRYQSPDDPAHAAFIARCHRFWQRVLVYDSLPA